MNHIPDFIAEKLEPGTSGPEHFMTMSDGSADGVEEKPKGKIVVGGFPVGDEAFKAALEGFHTEYPDIEVEFQFLASGDYHQQLQTALAAKTGAPDVAMVEGAQIGLYRDAGVMENLLADPYNAGELAADFVDYKWNQALSIDGSELCGIVWDIGPSTYFYRADIFEEVGLPSEPEAVAELMSTYEGIWGGLPRFRTVIWFFLESIIMSLRLLWKIRKKVYGANKIIILFL